MSVAATNPSLIWAILGFALVSIVVLSALQGYRFYRCTRAKWSTNYIVLVGLVAIASLASVLALSAVPQATETAAFTLFGTIAGYLATRKVPGEDGPDSPGPSGPKTEDPKTEDGHD